MYSKRLFEIICGIIILLIIALFVVYTVHILFKRSNSTYTIHAYFNEVGGLLDGSPVIIKGVKVGTVLKVRINQDNNILVYLTLDSAIKVPLDSIISIKDTDLFSGRKVDIIPGKSTNFAKNGSILKNTKDYLYLEDKINSIIFSNK